MGTHGDQDVLNLKAATTTTREAENAAKEEDMTGKAHSGYRGKQNKTKNGRHCQMWTSQSPHNHTRTPENYPNMGLDDHNFCRNPDGEHTIWCYTTDSDKRWEYCEPLPITSTATTKVTTSTTTSMSSTTSSTSSSSTTTTSTTSATISATT